MRHVSLRLIQAAFTSIALLAASTACTPHWNGRPPAPTTIDDGTYTITTTATPTITWNESTWSQAGDFAGYQIAIGTSPGTRDILDWYSVGKVNSAAINSGISLTDGSTYFATVRAVTIDGRNSRVSAEGDGFIVNTTLPALKCDFSTGSSTDCYTTPSYTTARPMIRFSRAGGASTSPGTYVDSSGLIQTATTNLCTSSENFSSGWSTGNTSIVASATTAPDGTTNASKLREDSSVTTAHYLTYMPTISANTFYTCSVYLKAAERTQAVLYCGKSGAPFTRAGILINLIDGTFVNHDSASPLSVVNRSVTSVGNGWYRASLSVLTDTTSTDGNFEVRLYSTGTVNYTGDGTSGIYVWGAQLETGTTATNYTYTNGTSNYGPRLNHDPSNCAGGVCPRSGLLIEGSSNNQLLYSAALENAAWTQSDVSVTVDAMTSPDGTLSAEKVIANTNSIAHYISRPVSNTINQTSCGSYFVKAAEIRYIRVMNGNAAFPSFQKIEADLVTGSIYTTQGSPSVYGIRAFPNGWYRVWLCSTAGATGSGNISVQLLDNSQNATFAGNNSDGLYVWGGQFERGRAMPSSYIPTTSTALTRNDDSAALSGGLSSWYNSTTGTFGASGSLDSLAPNVSGYSQDYFDCTDGTANNRLLSRFRNRDSGIPSFFVWFNNSASSVARLDSTYLVTANTLAPFFITYADQDYAISVRGESAVTATAGNLPTGINQCFLGQNYNSGEFLNGSLKYFNYYDRRLSNEKIKALATP